MFNLETELYLREQERAHHEEDRADVLLRWGLVLSNLAVLALVVANLI